MQNLNHNVFDYGEDKPKKSGFCAQNEVMVQNIIWNENEHAIRADNAAVAYHLSEHIENALTTNVITKYCTHCT